MTASVPVGPPVTLPPLTGQLQVIWNLILDIADRLDPSEWMLVGGQMVMLHGLAASRIMTRASQDADVLADLLSRRTGLTSAVKVMQQLDLHPEPDTAGRVYRFRRAVDNATVDLLAPDHNVPGQRLRTIGGDTITIPGGRQALTRPLHLPVSGETGRTAVVPVPDLLGALVLKAAAWASDNRDRERHSLDAAFLTSLITDPIEQRDRFAGSDRRRLRRLDKVLANSDHPAWRSLGSFAGDAYTTWQILID